VDEEGRRWERNTTLTLRSVLFKGGFIVSHAIRHSNEHPLSLCEESFVINILERLCQKCTQICGVNRRAGVNEVMFDCHPILYCANQS